MDCADALGHLLGKAATWPRLPKRGKTPDPKEAYELHGCDGPPSCEGRYVAALAKAWSILPGMRCGIEKTNASAHLFAKAATGRLDSLESIAWANGLEHSSRQLSGYPQ